MIKRYNANSLSFTRGEHHHAALKKNEQKFLNFLIRRGGACFSRTARPISRFDRTLQGLKADDYHLNINRRLNEKIEQSWKEVLSNWNVFQQRADEDQQVTRTTLTRERWLLPLFQELGYGRLQQANIRQLNNREYPISHEWNGLPLHLLGAGVDLDRRNPGVSGAARQSPHSMMQQFLNASENHHWGLLSNGFKLRILRDSTRLTRQAYVEFDLYSILEGDVYSDFALLWLLCHQSRLENGDLGWLEHWSKEAGAGDSGVGQIGMEFNVHWNTSVQDYWHPQNKQLVQKLESGELRVWYFTVSCSPRLSSAFSLCC